MKLKQATAICKEMQKWRRGEGIYNGESPAPMPYAPETYGMALDKLIEHAEYKIDPMLADCLKRVDPDVRAEVRKKIEEPTKTCNSDKNLQEFDADYLQSKIDAFAEARRKDGKTGDDILNECRGGSLDLTWEDAKRIVNIADDIIDTNIPFDEEEYYTEVLRRFKEDSK